MFYECKYIKITCYYIFRTYNKTIYFLNISNVIHLTKILCWLIILRLLCIFLLQNVNDTIYFVVLIFTDSRFLLRFLRAKKFSVTQARVALERYLCLRQTFGVAFCCLDITIPMMEDLTDLGYLFACPKRDKLGRRVVVARPGK